MSRLIFLYIILCTLSCSIGQDDGLVEPALSIIQGIDISAYQQDIDWPAVESAGVSFVFIKAGSGASSIDPLFAQHWREARANGYKLGAYHFYYTNANASEQARHFIQHVLPVSEEDDLPPVLDLEGAGIDSPMSKEVFQDDVRTWLDLVEEAFGKTPIIYASYNFASEYLTRPSFARYPLWLAQYEVEKPTIPSVWQAKGWTFWQNSDTAHIKGIPGNVDHSYFAGDQQALDQLR